MYAINPVLVVEDVAQTSCLGEGEFRQEEISCKIQLYEYLNCGVKPWKIVWLFLTIYYNSGNCFQRNNWKTKKIHAERKVFQRLHCHAVQHVPHLDRDCLIYTAQLPPRAPPCSDYNQCRAAKCNLAVHAAARIQTLDPLNRENSHSQSLSSTSKVTWTNQVQLVWCNSQSITRLLRRRNRFIVMANCMASISPALKILNCL